MAARTATVVVRLQIDASTVADGRLVARTLTRRKRSISHARTADGAGVAACPTIGGVRDDARAFLAASGQCRIRAKTSGELSVCGCNCGASAVRRANAATRAAIAVVDIQIDAMVITGNHAGRTRNGRVGRQGRINRRLNSRIGANVGDDLRVGNRHKNRFNRCVFCRFNIANFIREDRRSIIDRRNIGERRVGRKRNFATDFRRWRA